MRKQSKVVVKKQRRVRKRKNVGIRDPNSSSVIQRGLIVAERQIVRLRYVETTSYVLGSVASSYAYNTYKLNSAYDFNSALGSTVITGFSEWSNFYSVYRVLSVRFHVDFVNINTTTPASVICGIYSSAGTAPFTSWSNIYELLGNKHCVTEMISMPGGIDRTRLSQKIDLPQLAGDARKYLADDSYAAAVNANPSVILHGYVFILSPSNTAFGSLSTVAVRIIADLEVQFSQRADLTS